MSQAARKKCGHVRGELPQARILHGCCCRQILSVVVISKADTDAPWSGALCY